LPVIKCFAGLLKAFVLEIFGRQKFFVFFWLMALYRVISAFALARYRGFLKGGILLLFTKRAFHAIKIGIGED
jgi:hypothetical protein